MNDIVLISGDPGRVDCIAKQCENVEEVAQNRKRKVVNVEYEGAPLTISSTSIGRPSTAIIIEELVRVSMETFIRVGTIGALQADIEVGDMTVAMGAAKKEGTSKHYESEAYPTVPDYDVLTSLVDPTEANDEDVRVGPVVSDDAPYNEFDEYVEDWNDAGLLAIEMEAVTVPSLACHRGSRADAICMVDDNPVAGMQKGVDSDEELPEKVKGNVEHTISISLNVVVDLA